jgi:diacylglycerol kinase
MINPKRLHRSFRCAFRGIYLAWTQEQSFRLQSLIALFVIGLIFYFPLKIWQVIILLMLIMLVLILELINSILERIIDVLKPRLHPYVEDVKDMMAATVLIAALASLIVGLIIFWPYFSEIFDLKFLSNFCVQNIHSCPLPRTSF